MIFRLAEFHNNIHTAFTNPRNLATQSNIFNKDAYLRASFARFSPHLQSPVISAESRDHYRRSDNELYCLEKHLDLQTLSQWVNGPCGQHTYISQCSIVCERVGYGQLGVRHTFSLHKSSFVGLTRRFNWWLDSTHLPQLRCNWRFINLMICDSVTITKNDTAIPICFPGKSKHKQHWPNHQNLLRAVKYTVHAPVYIYILTYTT